MRIRIAKIATVTCVLLAAIGFQAASAGAASAARADAPQGARSLRSADALDTAANKLHAKARSFHDDAIELRREAAQLIAGDDDGGGDGGTGGDGTTPDEGNARSANDQAADDGSDGDSDPQPSGDDIDQLLDDADTADDRGDVAQAQALKLEGKATKLRAGAARAISSNAVASAALKKAVGLHAQAAKVERSADAMRGDLVDPDTGGVDEGVVTALDATLNRAVKLRASADRQDAKVLAALR